MFVKLEWIHQVPDPSFGPWGHEAPSLDQDAMPINIPFKQNRRLEHVLQLVEADEELAQFWRCANINAVDRMKLSDHGYVHVKIVANMALKLLRLLVEAGVQPAVVADHHLTPDDAEVVVVLASLLHDTGMAIHRDRHEIYSLFIANRHLPRLLAPAYENPERLTLISEILHAIVSHQPDEDCLTVEAGVVKIANALDISQGRSRIPFEAGKINIHSVSAMAIDAVHLKKGDTKPVLIEIVMNNSAGIFQLDELLKHKLKSSGLEGYLEVEAKIEGETDKKLIRLYNI